MKKILLAILILCNVLFISSCQGNEKQSAMDKIEEKNQEAESLSLTTDPLKSIDYNWSIYEGLMSNGNHIGMYLVFEENDSIHGYYFYSRHQKLIELQGIYSPKTGEYVVSEYYNSKLTGIFNLKNANGTLTGTWQKSAKSEKQKGVELFFVENQRSLKPTIVFSRYESKHTTIEYTTEEESDVTDELFIAKISDNTALFDYSVTGANWHTGQVYGKLEYSNDNTADFKGEESCELSFNFEKKKVSIIESDCQYYRGMRAYFDNELTKK